VVIIICCLTLYSSTRLNDFAQLSFWTERDLTLSCYQLFINILLRVTVQSPEIKSSLFCFPGSWLRLPRDLLLCKRSQNKGRVNGAKTTLHNDRLITLTCLCLSNRIKMSKSDIYVPSCHIYVQITLYISKVQYICPKLRYVYPNPATCFRFIYNSQNDFTYFNTVSIYIFHELFSIYISCGQYFM